MCCYFRMIGNFNNDDTQDSLDLKDFDECFNDFSTAPTSAFVSSTPLKKYLEDLNCEQLKE